jgi:hypothetical protein
VTITRPDAYAHLESVARDAWTKMELPKGLLPICEDNGDYFCMEQSGRVIYWSHNGATDESWPNLATGLLRCGLARMGSLLTVGLTGRRTSGKRANGPNFISTA